MQLIWLRFKLPKKGKGVDVRFSLLVLLNYLGHDGNGGSPHNVADFFGISVGGFYAHLKRSMKAVLTFVDEVLTWPDEEERKRIAAEFEKIAGFPNCVGAIDGTLFPLAMKPSHDHDSYYTHNYAIHALITCDNLC